MNYQEAIEYMRKEAHRQTVNSEGQDAYIIAISAMLELQEYKKLGALEEVRDAVERQQAKKPNKVGTEGYRYTDTYRCPTCDGNFSGTGIADYCYHCGQKLNWEGTEE